MVVSKYQGNPDFLIKQHAQKLQVEGATTTTTTTTGHEGTKGMDTKL